MWTEEVSVDGRFGGKTALAKESNTGATPLNLKERICSVAPLGRFWALQYLIDSTPFTTSDSVRQS